MHIMPAYDGAHGSYISYQKTHHPGCLALALDMGSLANGQPKHSIELFYKHAWIWHVQQGFTRVKIRDSP
jgi:hypothetical protein